MSDKVPTCHVCLKQESIGWCYIWVESISKEKRHAVCATCSPYRVQPDRQCKRVRNYHVVLW